MDVESPGFLGLGADMSADIDLVSMILIGLLFTFGVVMAIRGRYETHRYVHIFEVVLSTVSQRVGFRTTYVV